MIVWVLYGFLIKQNSFLREVRITKLEPVIFKNAEDCYTVKENNKKEFIKEYEKVEMDCSPAEIVNGVKK